MLNWTTEVDPMLGQVDINEKRAMKEAKLKATRAVFEAFGAACDLLVDI